MDESTSDHTHPPSRQQAAVGGSRASSKATHAPSAKLWKKGNVHRTLRPLLGPPRARSLHSTSLPYYGYVGGPDGPHLYGVWVPGAAQPSRWLWGPSDSAMRFSSPGVLPSFRGIHLTAVKAADMPMTCERNLCPTGEGHDGTGPSSRYEGRVFSALTSLCPRKAVGYDQSWVCASWCSRCSCRNRIFGCIRPQVRSAALTWRPVLPCVDPSVPQAIPAVCVRRTSISVQVLPFGLSLSPRVFTKGSGGSPCSPWENRACAFSTTSTTGSYWLSLRSVYANTGIGALAPQPVGPSGQLGKEANSCRCRESLFSVWSLDSVNQTARLTQERAQSVLNCLNTFKNRTAAPLKQVSEAPGAYGGCSAAVTTTGAALYEYRFNTDSMAESRGGRGRAARLRVQVTPACCQTFTPWSDPSFLRAGVPLEQGLQARCGLHGCLRQGLGGTFNGLAVSGVWTGPQLPLHINCLELRGSTPGLEPSQETLTRRASTGPYGQHCDRCVHQPTMVVYAPVACRNSPATLLLWSQKHLRSLRAIHIPGLLNRTGRRAVTSCAPRRMETPSPDGPADLQRFGLAQVDLFASLETSHCQLFYKEHSATDALAHSLQRGLRKYAFLPSEPSRTDTGKVREEEEQILLVAPYWPTRTWFPELMLLVTAPPWQDSSEEGSTDSETGHLMAPAVQISGDFMSGPRRDAEVLGGPTPARAPSTRHAYAFEVEHVRRLVLFSQRKLPEMPDQSRAILLAARVGAKACLPRALQQGPVWAL